jgi:hypothetical protein
MNRSSRFFAGVFVLGVLFLSPLSGQSTVTDLLVKAKLTEAEITAIEAQIVASDKEISQAKAAIEVLKTQLTQALLRPKVSRADLEPLVRQSVDQDFVIRMSRLDRQLKVRSLLGDPRWALLSKATRILAEDIKAGRAPKEDSTELSRLLHLLQGLGS